MTWSNTSRVLLCGLAFVGAVASLPSAAHAQFVCAGSATGAAPLSGAGASATGSGSTACGASAQSSAGGATAIGTETEASNGGATALGTLSRATGEFSIATGYSALANGRSAVATGTGAVATSDAATATGFGTNATAARATAIGTQATASHQESSAFGYGATTTRADQQMFGTSSNTYTMAGVASAASRSAQGAPTAIVTSNASGDLATHTAAELGLASSATVTGLQSQIDGLGRRDKQLADGIALSMALAQPILLDRQTFAMRVGWGGFSGSNAVGISASGLVARNVAGTGSSVVLDGGFGFAGDQAMKSGRVGVTFGF